MEVITLYKRPLRSDELYHYGRKGMKWGQHIFGEYQDSAGYAKKSSTSKVETIPKGSTLYRVVSNKDEKLGGSKYMTYFKSDRDLYRGPANAQLREFSKVNRDNSTYEKAFKTTKDLKIPTDEHMYDVLKKVVIDDCEAKIALGKASAEFYMHNGGGDDVHLKQLHKAYDLEKKGAEITKDMFKDDKGDSVNYIFGLYKNRYRVRAESVISDIDGDNKGVAVEQAFSGFGSKLGSSIKNKVIGELKKEGYSAVTDYASVGGAAGFREGRQPLIVFDTGRSIKEVSTSKITKKKAIKAYRNYSDWMTKAIREDNGILIDETNK